jgi:hypothetical protein
MRDIYFSKDLYCTDEELTSSLYKDADSNEATAEIQMLPAFRRGKNGIGCSREK